MVSVLLLLLLLLLSPPPVDFFLQELKPRQVRVTRSRRRVNRFMEYEGIGLKLMKVGLRIFSLPEANDEVMYIFVS